MEYFWVEFLKKYEARRNQTIRLFEGSDFAVKEKHFAAYWFPNCFYVCLHGHIEHPVARADSGEVEITYDGRDFKELNVKLDLRALCIQRGIPFREGNLEHSRQLVADKIGAGKSLLEQIDKILAEEMEFKDYGRDI